MLACIWYVVDWSSYVRLVTFVVYMCFGVLAIFMSKDPIYLVVYKLALNFYLLAVFMIGGIEVSTIFLVEMCGLISSCASY